MFEILFDLIGIQVDCCYVVLDMGMIMLLVYMLMVFKVMMFGLGIDNVLLVVFDMCIECDGNQCWLVVKIMLDVLWL